MRKTKNTPTTACPHCASTDYTPNPDAFSDGGLRYKCRACGRQFNKPLEKAVMANIREWE